MQKRVKLTDGARKTKIKKKVITMGNQQFSRVQNKVRDHSAKQPNQEIKPHKNKNPTRTMTMMKNN